MIFYFNPWPYAQTLVPVTFTYNLRIMTWMSTYFSLEMRHHFLSVKQHLREILNVFYGYLNSYHGCVVYTSLCPVMMSILLWHHCVHIWFCFDPHTQPHKHILFQFKNWNVCSCWDCFSKKLGAPISASVGTGHQLVNMQVPFRLGHLLMHNLSVKCTVYCGLLI